MRVFNSSELNKLYRPANDSSGEDNGQITIVGGSKLFHGAPILSLKVASRIVDMVFFASPEPSVGEVANAIKSKLMSFIWVPWEDTEDYINKSDAVLIGPGFMRFGSERTPHEERSADNHLEGQLTKEITKTLLGKFPDKNWVIDAGSLQTMEADWIPQNAVLTPNKKEFEMLFDESIKELEGNRLKDLVIKKAQDYHCTIVLKGPETVVCPPASSTTKSLRAGSPDDCVLVKGGNAGLTKGGTGDVLAGLTAALLAKNDPFLAAASASCIAKAAADELYEKVGTNYNADDLADRIPEVLPQLTS